MASTQWLMARLFIDVRADDLPSMFSARLGPKWAKLFNSTYLVLFFCLLVAYWSGTRATFGIFKYQNLAFSLTIVAVVLCLKFGFKVAGPVSSFLTICMSIFFVCLVLCAIGGEGEGLLRPMNFGKITGTLPIVICSYGFFCAIPLVCRELNYDRRKVKQAIAMGTTLPLIFNLVVLAIGFRMLTQRELAEGAANGWPLFIALSKKLSMQSFVIIGNLFSIFAILSSLIGVSVAVQGAVRDIIKTKANPLFFAEFAAVLLTPVVVSVRCPGIFIKTLEFSGGILVNFMVCMFPIIVLIKERSMDLWYTALFLISFWIFYIEIGKLFIRG
jgi:tyrosine-specific transport protein